MNTAVAAAAALAERLRNLEFTVETLHVQAFHVMAPDYPGGVRPTGLVTLGGRGCLGRGEHVAFDETEQARFAVQASVPLFVSRATLGDGPAPFAMTSDQERWRGAALQGALIDLALRQADLSMSDLVEAPSPDPMRFLVSFDACPDPASRLHALSRHYPGARYKVDVDPSWDEPAIAALASTGAVEVLDFKGRGDRSLVDRLAQRLPDALLEDPPAGAAIEAARVVRDMGLTTVAEVARAVAAGHRVNLKAPRMGGFLAALDGLAACAASSLPQPASFGGMFEVGVGRRQARALAALYTPGAGNDLAPLRAVEPPPGAGDHLLVSLDRPGFGVR